MIRNRDKYTWKIKDIAECRSRGSRDQSHGVREGHVMAESRMGDGRSKWSCDQS
jgi:hypothetical protein